MKRIIFLLIIQALIQFTIKAQPYTYTISYNDTLPGAYAYSIYQYDYKTKVKSLVQDSLYINDYTMDNTGNWLIIDQPHDATLLINNIESKKVSS